MFAHKVRVPCSVHDYRRGATPVEIPNLGCYPKINPCSKPIPSPMPGPNSNPYPKALSYRRNCLFRKLLLKQGKNLLIVVLVFRHILETPVTERTFLEQLHELNHKINFVKQHAYNDTAACKDVQDVVDKLKFKVRLAHALYILHFLDVKLDFLDSPQLELM